MGFKLEIKKADGSTYWVEYFNEKKDAEAWIKEEKTRPYWDVAFTYKIDEQKPVQKTADQIKENEKLDKILKKKDSAKKLIKAIDLDSEISNDDLKKIVKALIELQD